MKLAYALISLVCNKQDVICKVNATLPEQLQVMNGALRLVNTYDFTVLPINHNLVFDGMAFLLAGIAPSLFF